MNRRLPTLEDFRQRLSHFDALPQLVILGILVGLCTGAVILLFRLAIEWPQTLLLPAGISDRFESLPPEQRVLFPVLGSILLLLFLKLLPPAARSVGVPHLLERLNYHQGRIGFRNLITQLVGGAIALSCGQSVGREGPAVYLGGAVGSQLGQILHLPNNVLRVLVGSGSAAAIAAVFNTPLAGVIFAMEVILLEYSIIGFIPVMVAAVVADVFMQLSLGHTSVLNLHTPPTSMLSELPMLLVLGVVIGVIAALFIFTLKQSLRLRHQPLSWRLIGAGLLTGAVGLLVPEVMGTGYDSIEQLFTDHKSITLLVVLLFAKTLLTPTIIGLGIPGGLIGPSLMIGALSGSLLAAIGHLMGIHVSSDLLTFIGMGSMMGAVLNAPLAALIALLELTDKSGIILPGMLAIVVSNITLRSVFNCSSAFQTTLEAQGLDQRQAPLAQALSRAAVGSLMQRNLIQTERKLSLSAAESLLAQQPHWLLLERNGNPIIMPPGDLISWLHKPDHELATDELIDLMQIPGDRQDAVSILSRATLLEAWQLMAQREVDALLVLSNQQQPLGIISRKQIEEYYNYRQAL